MRDRQDHYLPGDSGDCGYCAEPGPSAEIVEGRGNEATVRAARALTASVFLSAQRRRSGLLNELCVHGFGSRHGETTAGRGNDGGSHAERVRAEAIDHQPYRDGAG